MGRPRSLRDAAQSARRLPRAALIDQVSLSRPAIRRIMNGR